MAEQENQKLDNRRIIAIGLVLIIAAAGFVTVYQIGAQAIKCNNPVTVKRCTFTTIFISAGSNFGQTIITFNPPFQSIPVITMGAATSFGSQPAPLPAGTLPFLSVETPGQAWPNMPVAKTELFGDTTHEIEDGIQGNLPYQFVVTASFSVTCNTGSFNGTAILRPEFNNGGVWTAVSATTTGLDVSVSASTCAAGFSPTIAADSIVSSLKVANPVMFRVVGMNGFGPGDNPTFVNITLQFFLNVFVRPICSQVGGSTTSQFTLEADIIIPQTSTIAVTCNWTAEA